jgi:hypothetical protein
VYFRLKNTNQKHKQKPQKKETVMAKTNKQIIDEYQAKINESMPGGIKMPKATVRDILIDKGIIKARRRRVHDLDALPAVVGEIRPIGNHYRDSTPNVRF